jgi:hypothetical protein
MKRAALALALLLLAPTLAVAQDSAADVKANCAAEWPGDYAMQQWCLKRNGDAAAALAALTGEEPPRHVKEIVVACAKQWPGAVAGHDWPMVEWCVRRQLAAYDAIK